LDAAKEGNGYHSPDADRRGRFPLAPQGSSVAGRGADGGGGQDEDLGAVGRSIQLGDDGGRVDEQQESGGSRGAAREGG